MRVKHVFSGPVAAHCFALTADGRCFSWGRNEHGELGQGHVTNIYKPTELTNIPFASKSLSTTTPEVSEGNGESSQEPVKEKIIAGACGGHHSIIVSNLGNVYTAGQGSSGQLGIGKMPETQKSFVRIPGSAFNGEKAVNCSAGREFSMVVTEEGSVFSFGHPIYGQLGNGTEGKYIERANKITYTFLKVPYKIAFQRPESDSPLGKAEKDKPVKIKGVACGANHTIAMDEEGKLYSWGFGGYGRLGHKDNKDQMAPKAVKLFHEEEKPVDLNLPKFMQRRVPPTRATAIGCGASASFAVVGEPYFALYQWGITKRTGEAFMYPQICMQVSGWKIRTFACGITSTMIASERKVISWGPSPTYGELAYGPDGPKSSTVSREVESLSEAIIKQVAMGSSHSLAIIDIDDVKGPKILEALPVFDPQKEPKPGVEIKKKKARRKSDPGKNKKKQKTADPVEE